MKLVTPAAPLVSINKVLFFSRHLIFSGISLLLLLLLLLVLSLLSSFVVIIWLPLLVMFLIQQKFKCCNKPRFVRKVLAQMLQSAFSYCWFADWLMMQIYLDFYPRLEVTSSKCLLCVFFYILRFNRIKRNILEPFLLKFNFTSYLSVFNSNEGK